MFLGLGLKEVQGIYFYDEVLHSKFLTLYNIHGDYIMIFLFLVFGQKNKYKFIILLYFVVSYYLFIYLFSFIFYYLYFILLIYIVKVEGGKMSSRITFFIQKLVAFLNK